MLVGIVCFYVMADLCAVGGGIVDYPSIAVHVVYKIPSMAFPPA